jgi:proteasome accessory factor C
MDLFDRIYRLHAVLRRARYPVSRATLEHELECKRATVNRIIKEARLYLHAPIKYDRARNGYLLAQDEGGPWELPGLWFNASELHALLAAHELLTGVQPGLLESALAPLRERIEQILKSRGSGGREVARRVRILRIASRRVEPAHFRSVAGAALARKRLRIIYHGRERDATTEREISPQRLVHYRDNWYLDAWDHAKRALRVFSIDRIRESETLDKPAKDIPDVRLDAHFASSYGIFAGRPRRKAVLRFTRARAR